MDASKARSLGDPDLRAERVRRAKTQANVRPINRWVTRLSEARGEPGSVPLLDPDCGGVNARVLFLLEAPGRMAVADTRGLATAGSGLLSADNDDPTAANFWHALSKSRLPYSEVALWNSVPWYVGTAGKIGQPSAVELREARPLLGKLLSMLPLLEVVMPLGRVAQRQWAAFQTTQPTYLVTIPSLHPSPLSLNRLPSNRSDLVRAMRRARTTIAV